MLKRTPLFAAHQRLGGKLIEFGGWEMPVQYSSIIEEHLAVRRAAGMFDISHMGEVLVTGVQAAAFLNQTLTNDMRRLAVGLGQYTLMCNERGGLVDDLYAYCLAEAEYLLIVNASRIEADVAWLHERLAGFPERARVTLKNASASFGAVAVQGPRVREFIDRCFPGAATGGTPVAKASELKKNQLAHLRFADDTVLIACTGYTGEDGFEVVGRDDVIPTVWEKLIEVGAAHGLQPCGLGTRDTLRTEMCYPLYGHELDENTTPLEAGLGFFVALDKGEFVGRSALAEQKANGVSKRCVALKMAGKSAPPRRGYLIWSPGATPAKLGLVTSGTQSPSLGIGIGLGYVPPEFARPDTPVEIEIRGKHAPAVVVRKHIYRKPV
jgi:aminomethyltransferase